jgi:hypothetical protein
VPDGLAGRRGKCKSCGAPLTVPDAVTASDGRADEPVSLPDPPPPRPLPPVEPWYYSFMIAYAYILIGLGIFSCVLSFISFTNIMQEREPSLRLAKLILPFASGLAAAGMGGTDPPGRRCRSQHLS